MNQSNKKNLEFIVNSGVNYFLQDSRRNWFENEKKADLPNPNINAGDKKNKIDRYEKLEINKQKNFTQQKILFLDNWN